MYAETVQHCCQRNDDEAILRAPKERAARRNSADYAQRLAHDDQLRANRIALPKEIIHDVGSKQTDGGVITRFGFGVKASRAYFGSLNVEHACGQPANLHAARDRVAPLELARQVGFRANGGALVTAAAHSFVIFILKPLPL